MVHGEGLFTVDLLQAWLCMRCCSARLLHAFFDLHA
jgi:hypothetical protein